jgi:hypothetical protein
MCGQAIEREYQISQIAHLGLFIKGFRAVPELLGLTVAHTGLKELGRTSLGVSPLIQVSRAAAARAGFLPASPGLKRSRSSFAES